MRKPMQRIAPFLWFDHQAEEAATFYVSIFKNSRITSVARNDDAAAKASGRPKGDRKSTRLNSSHGYISYAVFCLKKKKQQKDADRGSRPRAPGHRHPVGRRGGTNMRRREGFALRHDRRATGKPARPRAEDGAVAR